MSWFNSSWSYRRKFTSDNTKVASAYPYALILDLSQFPDDFFTKIKSGGVDIRITKSDGTTELARGVREVVTTAGSEAGFVYFHADGISTSADTDFYIYYGNGDATDYADDNALGMENVFSDEHRFYSTFKDATTSSVKDETSYDYDGTKKGANEPIEATGKIGKGQDFDGTDDRITTTTMGTSGQSCGKATFGGWFKSTSEDLENLWGIFNNTGTLGLQLYIHTNEILYFYIRDNNNVAFSLVGDEVTGFRDGNWHSIFVAWDSPNNKAVFYIDGQVYDATLNSTSKPTNFPNFQHAFAIGARNLRGTIGNFFDGDIDEFQMLFGVELTANEILTIYNNQSSNSTFWTVSGEETDSAAIGPFPTFFKVVF